MNYLQNYKLYEYSALFVKMIKIFIYFILLNDEIKSYSYFSGNYTENKLNYIDIHSIKMV